MQFIGITHNGEPWAGALAGSPGDVNATGTPEGVGYARTPQWLLQPGDTFEVEIEKLGTLTTPVGDLSLRSRA